MPELPMGDRDLLQAIVRQDHEAFQTLYKRYESPAYNLALKLTRNHHLAEEALQAGMLRVWKYARRCEEQNVRGWLMKIVANEGLRKLTERRKKRDRAERVEQNRDFIQPASQESDNSIEAEERKSALRDALDRLPGTSQQCLLLYFGADMSQRKIGSALGLSQRGVSLKIKEGLEALRTRLSAAGLAAMVPNEEATELVDVIGSGAEIPSGMGERILEHALNAKATSSGISSTGPIKITISLLLVGGLAIAANAYLFNDTSSETEQAPQAVSTDEPSEPAASSPSSPSSPPNAALTLLKEWSFEKSLPSDLTPAKGTWQWHPRKGSEPGHASGEKVIVPLPIRAKERSLVVVSRFLTKNFRAEGSWQWVQWGNEEKVFDCHMWADHWSTDTNPDEMEFRSYFHEKRMVLLYSNSFKKPLWEIDPKNIIAVKVWKKIHSEDRLYFGFGRWTPTYIFVCKIKSKFLADLPTLKDKALHVKNVDHVPENVLRP